MYMIGKRTITNDNNYEVREGSNRIIVEDGLLKLKKIGGIILYERHGNVVVERFQSGKVFYKGEVDKYGRRQGEWDGLVWKDNSIIEIIGKWKRGKNGIIPDLKPPYTTSKLLEYYYA